MTRQAGPSIRAGASFATLALALSAAPAQAAAPDVNQRLDALEADVAALQADVAALQAQDAAFAKDLGSLTATVQTLEMQLSDGKPGTAAITWQDIDPTTVPAYIYGLEGILTVAPGPEVRFDGANVVVTNGTGATTSVNGLGNVVVGYNDANITPAPVRTGSHNLVIGRFHSYTSYGGVVAGILNTVSGPAASVTGGFGNEASGVGASITGGSNNVASGEHSSVTGGSDHTAVGDRASVVGGAGNIADGFNTTVSGGLQNVADGIWTTATGGSGNQALGDTSTVSGGWSNTAAGLGASVSGGEGNTASGTRSSVSGGLSRTAPGTHDWVAGALFQTN